MKINIIILEKNKRFLVINNLVIKLPKIFNRRNKKNEKI